MKQSPQVSVIIPVYNAQGYISQAIDSILTQTFQDFECIIINDGSTDKTLKILERYAAQDSRIALRSRENRGLIRTLNEMIDQAQGELIARMDADDIAYPDRLAQQVEFLNQQPDVVCVGGSYEVIDHKGRSLTRLTLPTHDAEIQSLLLQGHCPICHPTVVIRRSVLKQVNGYNPSMIHAEDLDLWLRIGELGLLANLPIPVLKYRIHPNSVSSLNYQIQFQTTYKACQEAWARRQIAGVFTLAEPFRASKDKLSQHHFALKYGWWAYNSQHRQTALIYALKAIGLQFFDQGGWKLLACIFLKPKPRLKLDPEGLN